MLATKSALALTSVFGLSGTVHAECLSYTYGDVGYARVTDETGDVDFDGGELQAAQLEQLLAEVKLPRVPGSAAFPALL